MVERALVERLAAEMALPVAGVDGAAALLADGATVPFIARYRKERIAGLHEDELWAVAQALRRHRTLELRKAKVLNELAAQGTLNDATTQAVGACASLTELEELHQHCRAKRRSRGTLARERGLEPLAQAILAQTPGGPSLEEMAAPYAAKERGVPDAAAALEGASHIIAEAVADDPAARGRIRQLFADSGIVRARVADDHAGRPSKYEMYYDFSEPVAKIPSHRFLAVRRGDKEGWLRVSVEADRERALQILREGRIKSPETPAATIVETALADAYDRLLAPGFAAELNAELKRRADAEAIHVFARNLRSLLLQPPVGPRRTLGISPNPRGSCALAVADEQGKLLEHATLHLPPPQLKPAASKDPPAQPSAPEAIPSAPDPAAAPAAASAPAEAAPSPPAPAPAPEPEKPVASEAHAALRALIEKHQVAAIAIGNGTGSREADQFVRELLKAMPDRRPIRALVSDAGAAGYAASRAAREEFPDLTPPARAAVSIARRLQDPLAELAQGDPRTIGVGQYQHDVNQESLHEALRATLESCVSLVGVDVNRAPAALLAHVAGVGRAAAREIVRVRSDQGPFRSRAQLKLVPRLSEKQFQQAAGFLRVHGGDEPLDATSIHPERYELVARIAADLGCPVPQLLGNEEAIAKIGIARYVADDAGEETLSDITRWLLRPGRDPRGLFHYVECHPNVNSLEDLKPGMVLEGTVTNVTNFGAFVDIGLPEDGLVHVSHLARRYVRDANQAVGVGRVVRVKVLAVDMSRRRIALSIRDALPPPPRRKPRPQRQAAPPPQREPIAGGGRPAPERPRQQERPADARPARRGPPQQRRPPQQARPPQQPRPPQPPRPPQEAKPKRDPFSPATPEDIARLIAHFHGRSA